MGLSRLAHGLVQIGALGENVLSRDDCRSEDQSLRPLRSAFVMNMTIAPQYWLRFTMRERRDRRMNG